MLNARTLIGPLLQATLWDEDTKGQPYITAPNIYDGRYILMFEERKERKIRIEYTYYTYPYVNYHDKHFPVGCYPTHTASWDKGKFIGGSFFPHRVHQYVNYQNPYNIVHGYVSQWASDSIIEPIYRESTWTILDYCGPLHTKSAGMLYRKIKYVSLHVYPKLTHNLGQYVNVPSIFNDALVYAIGDRIIHTQVNRLMFFERSSKDGGIPQDNLYMSSILTEEEYTETYYAKNMSTSTTLKKIVFEIPDETLPAGVTISITGMPTELAPEEEVPITVTVTYVPPANMPPTHYVSVPTKISYSVLYDTKCVPDVITHVITSSASGGITISPAGATEVIEHDNMTYSITVPITHKLKSVTIDGIPVNVSDLTLNQTDNSRIYTYTFNDVISTHSIDVVGEVKPITYILGFKTSIGTLDTEELAPTKVMAASRPTINPVFMPIANNVWEVVADTTVQNGQVQVDTPYLVDSITYTEATYDRNNNLVSTESMVSVLPITNNGSTCTFNIPAVTTSYLFTINLIKGITVTVLTNLENSCSVTGVGVKKPTYSQLRPNLLSTANPTSIWTKIPSGETIAVTITIAEGFTFDYAEYESEVPEEHTITPKPNGTFVIEDIDITQALTIKIYCKTIKLTVTPIYDTEVAELSPAVVTEYNYGETVNILVKEKIV